MVGLCSGISTGSDIECGGLNVLVELSDDGRWDDSNRARIQRLSRRGVKTTSAVEDEGPRCCLVGRKVPCWMNGMR
jgi:hypothetical protein